MDKIEKAIEYMLQIANNQNKEVIEDVLEIIDDISEPKTIEEWGEDYGDCLWWKFPVEEPPYCGNPLDCNFPDYVTHFTRLIIPIEPNN